MTDCPNAEMRDLLPDLLHDRLAATVRAEVAGHVDACADCREELELLREVRAALVSYTPRVDVAHVVKALPKPPRAAARPIAPRRTWADWRVAAAVTMLAVGGSSVALVARGDRAGVRGSGVALVPVVESLAPSGAGTSGGSMSVASAATEPNRTVNTVASNDQAGGLGVAGHLADLDESQLRSLIDEIEQMKAVPITEPEPVSITVDAKAPSLPEGQ